MRVRARLERLERRDPPGGAEGHAPLLEVWLPENGRDGLSSTSQLMGSLLLAVAPISLVVRGVGTMSITSCRPVGQARRRTMVATRSPADKHVADALAAMAEQGG
jgi:hypothetical protein